jgi:hypothetical protein
VLHGEVEGLFPTDRSALEYGGALLSREELARGGWSYVALGHYHVQRQVASRVWYSGALEYVSPNPWGELADERAHGIPGKGWLLVDPGSGVVEPQWVPLARQVLDLPPIDGAGKNALELDKAVAAQLGSIPGGLSDQVVRQVVSSVPRHIGREMNHAAIRGYKADALHFQLDLRRPEVRRETGVGAPGRRQTLPEIVQDFLARRIIPGDLDRETFVRVGHDLMAEVEREWAEG